MEQQLILNGTIYGNLRRTLKKHLLSSKSVFQINELALKYFGIYDDAGELIGYQCPYSGKKITNTKKIILEHMIPVNSGGGTTLFNCIPTSEIVNKLNEKGSKHLIEWWINSKYWDSDAPKRLEKLVQYILESYEITFNQNKMGYDDIDVEELDDVDYDHGFDDETDLTTTQEEQQLETTSLISYYGFINDVLNELKNYIDINSYKLKLQTLVEQNIFGNIDRQTKIQEFLKEFLKNKFDFEDRTELRFVLNIDIESLSKSLEKYSDGDMFLELERRINNIESILDNNNLSLYSFFEDKNVLNYLNKSIEELTNDDISNLINDINVCARYRFNEFIDFILEHGGILPRPASHDKKEKRIGSFRYSIQYFDESHNCMRTILLKEQLEYLHNSDYKSLREMYKTILYKTVEKRIETGDNSIKIDYEDLDMVSRIQEYLNKGKGKTIEEQIELERKYRDYIVIDSQFNEFISFVLEHNGVLPSGKSNNEYEKRVGKYRNSIQHYNKRLKNMDTRLSKEQLEYLHNSKYGSLRELYKNILYRIVEERFDTRDNSIKIDYEDAEMVFKIQEYLNNKKGATLEEQIELERKYKDCIVIDSQFNEFIGFVLEHDGVLPSIGKLNDEEEKKLGSYKFSIQYYDKNRNSMGAKLSREQLEYLHDSEYESLREIYKTILYKIVENRNETGNSNIKIDFEDYDMVFKIQEYLNKRKKMKLEEQVELEREYKDYIVIDSQFNEFISFVLEHHGVLPSKRSNDEREKKMGNFKCSIQKLNKEFNIMDTRLSKEQLEYLHNSEYESLRELYKIILYKIVERRINIGDNSIKIDYEDTNMVVKIQEYLNKIRGTSIEEQIKLESEYKDYIVIDSQFNEFIGFVLEHDGILPNAGSKYEKEKRLGNYRTSIQYFEKKRDCMKASISREQLKYLHNSEYESLREIYDNIIRKAYENGYSEYIEFDKEIKKETGKVGLDAGESIIKGRIS